MNLVELINNLNPEMHAKLKKSLEIGKWPDGKVLSYEQKELAMEVLVNYEYRILTDEQLADQQRVGYIEKSKMNIKDNNPDQISVEDSTNTITPLKWLR